MKGLRRRWKISIKPCPRKRKGLGRSCGKGKFRERTLLIELLTYLRAFPLNATLDNIPRLKAITDDDLWLNPQDAENRNIPPGESVKTFNDRGQVIRKANVTDRIMPGVVSLEAGSRYSPDEQGVDRGGLRECPYRG
jgi:nitrate reductase alpha subunit